jgi:hypothetical protein
MLFKTLEETGFVYWWLQTLNNPLSVLVLLLLKLPLYLLGIEELQ